MFELNDLANRLLGALIGAPLAWQAPEQLAILIGSTKDETTEILAGLDLAGWIDSWHMGESLFITLTPGGADRLGVRLEVIGRSDALRWRSVTEPEPLPPRASGKHEDLSSLDYVVDPTPSPEAFAIAGEMAMKVIARKQAEPDTPWQQFLPRPQLFIGSTLSPWPGPKACLVKICPACGLRPIPEIAYCLVCDRWGLDHLLATERVTRLAKPAKPTGPAHRYDPVAARQVRKAKHRRMLAQKIAQESPRKANPGDEINPMA